MSIFSREEDAQRIREEVSDALIDRDDYFLMDDPVPFLEWAVENAAHFVDLNGHGDVELDCHALYDHWTTQQPATHGQV